MSDHQFYILVANLWLIAHTILPLMSRKRNGLYGINYVDHIVTLAASIYFFYLAFA